MNIAASHDAGGNAAGQEATCSAGETILVFMPRERPDFEKTARPL
ncbi:hypothetical protein [Pseudomonas syringae]|nr:hypothetical protein [Pseudomonas syringae]MDF7796390.1 hypothetical protein [Pseudomonas syringae]